MANMVGVLRQLGDLAAFCWKGVVAADFVSCWTQLNESCRRQLVRRLEMAFSSPNIPPEILATLLNLAEFMEHDETPLPTDIRLLGALAKKCPAFAKALHYKEMEFEGACSNRMDGNLVAVVEAMIHINNQLHQHEAAVGILTYAQKHLGVQLKESWYEHNINVMMAACDTFRSGVVEQLRTHARRLRVDYSDKLVNYIRFRNSSNSSGKCYATIRSQFSSRVMKRIPQL